MQRREFLTMRHETDSSATKVSDTSQTSSIDTNLTRRNLLRAASILLTPGLLTACNGSHPISQGLVTSISDVADSLNNLLPSEEAREYEAAIGDIPVIFVVKKNVILDVKIRGDITQMEVERVNNAFIPTIESELKKSPEQRNRNIIARLSLIVGKKNSDIGVSDRNLGIAKKYLQIAFNTAHQQLEEFQEWEKYLSPTERFTSTGKRLPFRKFFAYTAGEAAERMGYTIMAQMESGKIPEYLRQHRAKEARDSFVNADHIYRILEDTLKEMRSLSGFTHALLMLADFPPTEESVSKLHKRISEVCLRAGNLFNFAQLETNKKARYAKGEEKILYDEESITLRGNALGYYERALKYNRNPYENPEAHLRMATMLRWGFPPKEGLQALKLHTGDPMNRRSWETSLDYYRNVSEVARSGAPFPMPRGESIERWKDIIRYSVSTMDRELPQWVQLDIQQRTAKRSDFSDKIWVCKNNKGQTLLKATSSLEEFKTDAGKVFLCPYNNDPGFQQLAIHDQVEEIMTGYPSVRQAVIRSTSFQDRYGDFFRMSFHDKVTTILAKL